MRKGIFYLLPLFTILLTTVYSCGDNNEDTPPNVSPSVTIPESENLHPTLSQQGGTAFVTFTATGNWTASIANTRADSWISINPISGGKGEAQIAITTQANETFDERNATIHLKCGTDVKNIIVSQKQKDALTITSSKFEIDSNGGNINIEVKANITFEIDIKSDWIKQVKTTKTRALTTSNLNFAIDPNKTGDKREGEIIIKSGEFSETIKVYQGFEKVITLTQKDFSLPMEGGDINIEIKSTLEYETKMLSNVDWITEIKSRAISTHTHHYKVMPNESYDSREVKIVFYSLEDENIADTVSVYQMYKDDILVSQDEYNIDAEGGILNLKINTNVKFNISTSVNWIEQINTRSLTEKQLSFTILENTIDETREGIITISSDQLEKNIRVIQKGRKIFSIKQKEYTVSAAGEEIQVEVVTTGEYIIQLPNINWITETTTKTATTNIHKFTITANKGFDTRSAEIAFTDKESGNTEIVKIIQMQQDAIIISQEEYTIEAKGEILEINVNSNIEFTTKTSDNWIQQVITRALSAKTLRFTITENENESTRIGSITLKGNNITRTITIKQLGEKNTGGNIEDMPTQPW